MREFDRTVGMLNARTQLATDGTTVTSDLQQKLEQQTPVSFLDQTWTGSIDNNIPDQSGQTALDSVRC